MNVGGKGSVLVTVDWAELSAASDPIRFLVDRAASEVSLTKRYNEHESAYLKQDPVLRESARRGFLYVRGKATSVPQDQYRAQKKGQEFVTPPTQFRLRLHYTRPKTRGVFDRSLRRDP